MVGPTTQVTPEIIVLATITFLPLWLPAISGAVLLPIAAKRSKDKTLHCQVLWFGLFAVFVLGVVILAPSTGTRTTTSYLQDLILLVGFLGGGYSLYGSARSLVPLNRVMSD